MKIIRYYESLEDRIHPNKALLILGPRRVGKTTLLTDFLDKTTLKYRLDSGDNIKVQEILGSQDFDLIKEYAAGYELIAIDEAQRIPNVGLGLKILVDQIPNIKIIATGSSSFELAGQVGEPLTGRKTTLTLYPISQLELAKYYNRHELTQQIGERLVYGSYPEIFTALGNIAREKILEELVHSYLLKDILELEQVKGAKILLDLLRLIAYQIGHEVSLSELGRQIGVDTKTVGRYLDLFEKSFVLCNLRGFSKNLRKEITKKSKYYFYDTGIRNAVISNFNPISARDDVGVLWENFIFIERLKKRAYGDIFANQYFWRTWDQKEVDLVEERKGKFFGYEFKWSRPDRAKGKYWLSSYPNASFDVITKENFLEFVA